MRVQYKRDIILRCGDSEKDVIADNDEDGIQDVTDDDDDNDGIKDDVDDDDDNDGETDEEERKKKLWKDVQFFRAPPKSANASPNEPGPAYELINPDGKLYIFNSNKNTLRIHRPSLSKY